MHFLKQLILRRQAATSIVLSRNLFHRHQKVQIQYLSTSSSLREHKHSFPLLRHHLIIRNCQLLPTAHLETTPTKRNISTNTSRGSPPSKRKPLHILKTRSNPKGHHSPSPLSTPVHSQNESDDDNELKTDGKGLCVAYCVANTISLPRVRKQLARRKIVSTSPSNNAPSTRLQINNVNHISPDALHAIVRSTTTTTTTMTTQSHLCPPDADDTKDVGHAFFFNSGAVVCWGLPMTVRRHMFATCTGAQEGKAKSRLGMEDFEHDFHYTVDPTLQEPTFRHDVIRLSPTTKPTHLLALSYGLAQSARLLVYEEAVDELVSRTQKLPTELAKYGYVNLSHRALKQLTGELLAARYSVSLVSDILDTPEYFWQHAELERLHMECVREVELRQRAGILERRTEVIKDALAILNSEVSAVASDRVERAILFLIGVEVVIEVAKALLPFSTA